MSVHCALSIVGCVDIHGQSYLDGATPPPPVTKIAISFGPAGSQTSPLPTGWWVHSNFRYRPGVEMLKRTFASAKRSVTVALDHWKHSLARAEYLKQPPASHAGLARIGAVARMASTG